MPMNFNLKKKALKTNGASSKLGLSILLDPMLHDQINGKFKHCCAHCNCNNDI